MDTLTQAALGAAVGQAGFAKTLGRKANWYGAAAGLAPDLDVIWGAFAGEFQSLVVHRGPTHSIWFGPVVGTLLGYITWRYYTYRAQKNGTDSESPPPLKAWIGLWVLGLLTHPLLDVFTTYGTQLLSPFSDERFSLYAVGIIDPIYTLPLGIALFIGYRSRANPGRAMRSARWALGCTTLYLGYGMYQNDIAEKRAIAELETLGVEQTRLNAYPTLFQPWLRRIVARDSERVYVTYLSSISDNGGEWIAQEHHLEDARVQSVLSTTEGRIFEWFSDGQLVGFLPQNLDDPVFIDDFRYGTAMNPTRGIWGMQAHVDAHGQVSSTPTRFNIRPKDPKKMLGVLWRTLVGSGEMRAPSLKTSPSDNADK